MIEVDLYYVAWAGGEGEGDVVFKNFTDMSSGVAVKMFEKNDQPLCMKTGHTRRDLF